MEQLLQIPSVESKNRINNIQQLLINQNINAALVSDNANKFYLSGRVFNGYVFIPAQGDAIFFVRRPVELTGENVVYINKPENIADTLIQKDIDIPQSLGMELDLMPYAMAQRICKIFPNVLLSNLSSIMRQVRSVKSEYEIELLKLSGKKHVATYSKIPNLYRQNMTDLEFQVEIERTSRLEGCLGQFRISGDSMEIYMGNLICGENADAPSPYDFAMGGAGMHPSLPVGCNGTTITPDMAIMVDLNGNYTGYTTDMSRVFSVGILDELSIKAHECSRRICRELSSMGKPGIEAKALYNRAIEIVNDEGLVDLFMGHRQKAGFIGHGVGIEINESPVIAPRSRDILAVGNVIALEPKFVIPGIGAVGIENTYVVTTDGMESITLAPEEIISLD
ncbi:MAG: aminopeptidase P family protein [Muribaculaceae bacterium]|nr:aminopeptidase P family protein [Muribaculaceae bacterium]